jgi:hypothetical protein
VRKAMYIGIQNEKSLRTAKRSFLSRFLRAITVGRAEILPVCDTAKEKKELLEAIKCARKEWMCAYSNFEYADDGEMVDYYTYKIKACQLRYNYLIRQAKEKGVKVDFLETAGAAFYSEDVS